MTGYADKIRDVLYGNDQNAFFLLVLRKMKKRMKLLLWTGLFGFYGKGARRDCYV